MELTIIEAIDVASVWLDLDGVEGVGQGKVGRDACITVLLSSEKSRDKIPTMFHGYNVVIESSDKIYSQSSS